MAILRNSMVVAAALTFIACFSFRSVTAHPVDESLQYKLLMDLLSIPQKPHSSNVTRLGMTWKNCGSSDPIHANVVITPETIPIPGNIQLSFNATFDITFGAPLQLKLELKKKVVGIFVEIPCVDNIGSCTYDDLCSMIPFPPSQPCPEPLSTYKIPCQCPFPKGMYSLPPSSIEIPTIPDIPSWLTDGDYQATAHLSMSGRELACYEADVSLKAD